MTDRKQYHRGGVVYGVIVYWCTVSGALIVLLGSVLMLALGWSEIPIDHQFFTLLQGRTIDLHVQAMSANGVILLGLTLAIVSLVPAIVMSLPHLWRTGHQWVAVFGAANALFIAGAAVFAFC